MYLVPYFLVFLTMNRDPSYTKSIVSKRSVRNLTSEFEISDDSNPKWSNSYHAKGIISLPFAQINETFEAWYDKDNNFSRIDYQNGKTQTYQFSNYGSWGTNFKILQNDSSEKDNTKICFGVRGTNEYRIMPQIILPDLSYYALQAEQHWIYQKIEYWIYQSQKGHTITNHGIWLIKKNNINYPVKYEVIMMNSKFRLLLDSYVISYSYFDDKKIPLDIFDSLKNVTCNYHNPPHLDHVYSFNPMQEFINNHKDNYYYLRPIFEEFYRRHHNIYTNDSLEYVERKKIFHQNVRYIHWKNRGNVGYTLAMNQFTDRYPKELLAIFANDNLNAEYDEKNTFNYNNSDLTKIPSEFNWIDKGAVTSVKNQSGCSGWSFAISGAFEGAYFLKNKQLKRFSAQALTECIWRQTKNDCNDGGRIQALNLIQNEGLPTEEDYDLNPSKGGSCHMSNMANNILTKKAGYKYITSFDEDVLKYALFNHGPIAISIHASPKSFMFYSNGIYYDKDCHNILADLNHSALLVGYGTKNDIPYWIVKNSWTTEFGSLGYIYISRKDNNCGVLTSPTFVVLMD